LILGRI